MEITRRGFLKASSALAAAFGLQPPEGFRARRTEDVHAGPPVIWLHASSCSGCSVSLLNSIYYMTVDNLLLSTVSLKYHPTVMAAAGADAVAAAQAAAGEPGYVLIVEGAVPTAQQGRYCYLWPGLTALEGVRQFAEQAGFILAVGCSAYGGVVGGQPNPTGVQWLQRLIPQKQVINIPGCPAHPDWIVGTVAHLIEHGAAPDLDSRGRPRTFYGQKVHLECPNLAHFEAGRFGPDECLFELGCKGQMADADCPNRRWNSPAEGAAGVNWCVGARSPCIGCADHRFPDGMAPFYEPIKGGDRQPDDPDNVTLDNVQLDNPPPAHAESRPLSQYEKRRQYEQRRAKLRDEQKRQQQQRLEQIKRDAENRRLEYQRRKAQRSRTNSDPNRESSTE